MTTDPITARREPPVSFRPGSLAGALDERGANRNEVAARDLARYYALLERTRATLALTEAEASAVCDALNGTILDEHTVSLLWAEVDDACRVGLAEKWRVDGPALVAQLRGLSYAQCVALYDAVERFWREPIDDVTATLQRIGLVDQEEAGR